ncbi:hypothetical protein DFQ26_001065 [Actinomortierella ambigua]|nr:hypothetical protein DFQ26_001065 [Actinomortierella ambigua]
MLLKLVDIVIFLNFDCAYHSFHPSIHHVHGYDISSSISISVPEESDLFHQAVLELYMERFDFRKDPIDLALRKFLLDYHFPKEAQQIDRVLQAFANRYHACNPNLFRSSDIVYTLSFSLMLLHTDAHNKNVRFKMSKEQYIRQAKSIEGVSAIPSDILEILYDNITFLKFVYAEDDLDLAGQKMAEVQSSSWFPKRRTASTQRSDSYNMIRHGSITQLSPDLSDLIPFRWPYYWKGTIELVDNVQINNQFTKAPSAFIPGLRCRDASTSFESSHSPNGYGSGHGCSQPRADQLLSPVDRIDSPFDTVRTISFDHAEGSPATPTEMESVELRVAKQGILSRKIDVENGKKSTVRGWRELGVILSGSQLLFFTDLSWFHQQRRLSHGGFNPDAPPEVDGFFATGLSEDPPPMPQALISTHDSIAVVDSTYQKYPHVFRLVCPNGKQYLFRADNEREMNDWMSKINYATVFKTAGVRLRNYRVAWAGDVVWIRDDQGRYQLRRRRRKSTTQDTLQAQMQLQLQQQQFDEGRIDLLKSKLKEIDNLIHSCAAALTNELRFTRSLEVMIPLQPSTRQKIIGSATEAGRRLRRLMLERTKLDCYRTILERDLAVVVAPAVLNSSYWGVSQHQGDERSRPTSITAVSSGGPSGGSQPGTPLGSTTDPQREWIQERVKTALQQDGQSIGSPVSATTLDPSKASSPPIKLKPTRPKMGLNDFSRTVSESVLDEHHRHQRAVTVDFPHGPAAIQAAIIDAARGGSGLITSTMGSPDATNARSHESHHQRHHSAQEASTKAYRNTIMVPRANQSSSLTNQSPTNTAPPSPSTPVAPTLVVGPGSTSGSTIASPMRSKTDVGSPALLSPNTMPSTTNARSRALSLPPGAQRPPMPGTTLMTMNMPRTVSIYSSSSQTANRLKKILEQGLSHFKRRGKKEGAGGEGGLTDSIVSHATGSTPSVSSSGSSVSQISTGGGGQGSSSSASQAPQNRMSTSLSLSRKSSSVGSLREWSMPESGGPLGESLLPVRPSMGSDTAGSRTGTPRIQMISQWDSDDDNDEDDDDVDDDEGNVNDNGGVRDAATAAAAAGASGKEDNSILGDTAGKGDDENENDGKHIVVSPPSPLSTAQFQLDLNFGSELDLLSATQQTWEADGSNNKDDLSALTASLMVPNPLQVFIPSVEGGEEEAQEEEADHHQHGEEEEGGDSGPVSALKIQSATPSPQPPSSPSPPTMVDFDISNTVIDGDESS